MGSNSKVYVDNYLEGYHIPLVHPDLCRVDFDYYYDDLDSPAAQKMIREDYSFSDHVQEEDIEICEHVQKGLASAAYDRGRFSVDAEIGVHHFQEILKASYRDALTESKARKNGDS